MARRLATTANANSPRAGRLAGDRSSRPSVAATGAPDRDAASKVVMDGSGIGEARLVEEECSREIASRPYQEGGPDASGNEAVPRRKSRVGSSPPALSASPGTRDKGDRPRPNRGARGRGRGHEGRGAGLRGRRGV